MFQHEKMRRFGNTCKTDRDIGRLLSDLLAIAAVVPMDDFKKAAMERLAKSLSFDMGLWASGRTDDLHVHNIFAFNLPDTMLETWEEHKHEDKLLAGMIERPGVSLDILDFMSREHRHSLDIYREHSAHYGIENAIATAIPDPATGLLDIMSLYRKEAHKPFSDEDRRTKQFVFPLMIDMWRQNQITHIERLSSGVASGGAAIVDQEGWLRQIEPGFSGLLRSEWPGWTGPALPEPVSYWLRHGARDDFKCEHVIMSAAGVDDLTLLRIRDRIHAASLTPRERMIAEIYASGKTAVSIAKKKELSPSTVRRHIESVYHKLNVNTKIGLLRALSESQGNGG